MLKAKAICVKRATILIFLRIQMFSAPESARVFTLAGGVFNMHIHTHAYPHVHGGGEKMVLEVNVITQQKRVRSDLSSVSDHMCPSKEPLAY